MSDGLSIIIFAVFAAILFFKLRGVLGRRTGHEKRPVDPFSRRTGESARGEEGGKVLKLPDRPGAQEVPASSGAVTVARGLREIASADPAFHDEAFLEGARTAFGWIVDAFAKGDRDRLRQLVSNNVFEDFRAAIEAREAEGEELSTDLVRIKSSDILEAELQGRTAFITVKFVTEQINITRDHEGRIVDGEPGRIEEVTDIWTFARNTRSRDPNWTLVETRSPH